MFKLHRDTIVWWLLLAITAASWALSALEGSSLQMEARAARIAILVLAFVKVRLVLMHFMELAHAPVGLRAAAEAWVVLICAALIFQLW